MDLVDLVDLADLVVLPRITPLYIYTMNSLKANKNNQHSAHKINPTQVIVHISPMASEHVSSKHTHDLYAVFEFKNAFIATWEITKQF